MPGDGVDYAFESTDTGALRARVAAGMPLERLVKRPERCHTIEVMGLCD